MNSILLVRQSLLNSSRVGSLSRPGSRLTAGELAVLGGLGAIAAWATAFFHLGIHVPGHAILRGVLPMALGLAVVPRRGSGTIMGLSAGLMASALAFGPGARIQPAAMVGLVTLGPLLDLTMIRAGHGWRLYARLMAAGLAANLLAFAARFASAWLGLGRLGGGGGGGWGRSGGGPLPAFAATALLSFAICGAVAGLVGGLIWFRALKTIDEDTQPLGDVR